MSLPVGQNAVNLLLAMPNPQLLARNSASVTPAVAERQAVSWPRGRRNQSAGGFVSLLPLWIQSKETNQPGVRGPVQPSVSVAADTPVCAADIAAGSENSDS